MRLTHGNQIEWLFDGAGTGMDDGRRGRFPPSTRTYAVVNWMEPRIGRDRPRHLDQADQHGVRPRARIALHVSDPERTQDSLEHGQVVVDRLGEIFKAQAAAPTHVPVHVLVWELEDEIGGGFFGPFDKADGADELRKFFQNSHVHVGTFKGTQLLHVKFILLDGKIAYLVGSTMKQDYFGGTDHLLRDGQHGVQDKERKGRRGLLTMRA